MKMIRRDVLMKFLKESMEDEAECYEEARKAAGINCCGACMASGARDAYQNVMDFLLLMEKQNERTADICKA